jgi:hypothetical protein
VPRSLLLAVFLCAGWMAQPSRQLGTSNSNTYSLSGTVINSVTGEPIRGALVQIYSGSALAKLTGPDGEFRFDGLLAGGTMVSARKPGFFGEQELSAGSQRQRMTEIGSNLQPLVLRLYPEGLIFGRVTGEDGQPIENLPISVMSMHVINGRKQWQNHQFDSTDEEGEYRLAELAPGNYYLVVGPSRNVASTGLGASGHGPEGYAAAFYPVGRNLGSATPIKIDPGKHVQADFSLSREPFYRVSGTIVGNLQSQGWSVSLGNDSIENSQTGARVDPRTGSFQSGWLPPGPYTLRASSQDASGHSSSGSLRLNVTTNISNIRLVLEPSISISVSFRLDTSQRFPDNFIPGQVVLFSKERSLRNYPIFVGQEGPPGKESLVAKDLQPGAYSVEINTRDPWYVQSATYGLTDLLRDDLVVANGTVRQIEIVLRDDGANLNGAIVADGQKSPGALLLIPERAPNHPKEIFAGPDGSFGLNGIAPSNYKVLAFDRIDDLDYTNTEALRNYLVKAQSLSLAPNQKAVITVELTRREGER